MKLEIEELKMGVADRTYPIEVKATSRQECMKKLKRYLENFYEDKITITYCTYAPIKEWKDYMFVSFVRNGGTLRIKYK